MNVDIETLEQRLGGFITFEGGEGAGKTTQIARLAASLQERGRSVLVTREPGGTAGAEAIRQFVLSGEAEALGTDAEAVLFAAARLDHIAQVIRPALAEGRMVLCDRFHDSTRVYQGSAADADPEFLRVLEDAVLEEARPDLTLILDIAAETGLARAAARRAPDVPADRFERETVEIHAARRRAFLAIAKAESDRCVVIDAGRDEDIVADDVWTAVTRRFSI